MTLRLQPALHCLSLSVALLLVSWVAVAASSSSPVSSVASAPSFLSSLSSSSLHSLSIVRSHPHDVRHFTQGLAADNSPGLPNARRVIELYESTGVWGGTALHRYTLQIADQPLAAGSAVSTAGSVTAGSSLHLQSSLTLPLSIFGEGVCVWKDRLLQLTYQNQVFLSYAKSALGTTSNDDGTPRRSRATPAQVHRLAYPQSTASMLSAAPAARTFSEGWGITFNSHSQRVVVSDGSSSLFLLDPDVLSSVERTVDVHWIDSRGRKVPLDSINELEYVSSAESGVHGDRGEIFANLYETYCIVRIDPETGRVKGVLHADKRAFYEAPVKADRRRPHPAVEAMNGIAFHEATQTMMVTGKMWPRLFEVTAVPHPMSAAAAAASSSASASSDSAPLGFDLPSVCPRSDMGSSDLAYWQQVLAETAQRGMEEEAKEKGVMPRDAPKQKAATAAQNKQRWTAMPPHAQQMKARKEQGAAATASSATPVSASDSLLSTHSAALSALSASALPRFSSSVDSEFDEGAAPEPLSASTLLTLAEGAQSTSELGLDSSSAQFDPQLYVRQEMTRMRAEEMQEHRRQRARAHEGGAAAAEEGEEPQQVDFQFMQIGEREILSGDFM